MKKLISFLFSCLFLFIFSGLCFLASAKEVLTHQSPMTEGSFLDFLSSFLPPNVMLWITGVTALCATLATILPPIKQESSVIYSFIYKTIQFFAFNVGHAKNMQDRK